MTYDEILMSMVFVPFPEGPIGLLLLAALGAIVLVPLQAAIAGARQASTDGRCHAAILVGFGLGAAVTLAVGWALLLSAVFLVWLAPLAGGATAYWTARGIASLRSPSA